MSPLLLEAPWETQPQEVVAVDWDNALTRGLVLLTNGADGVNLAENPPITVVGSVPRGVSRHGVGLSFSNSINNYLTAPYTASAPSGTGLALFHLPSSASGSNRSLIGAFRSAGGGGVDAHYLSVDGTGTTLAAITSDNDNWVAASVSLPGFNRDYWLAGTFESGGGRSLWVDGAKVATNATARTPTGIDRVLVGVYTNPSFSRFAPFVGTIYLTAWWDRVLDDAELEALSENPWQLFRAPVRFHRPLTGAPAGAVLAGDLSVTVTTTGALTVPKPLAGALTSATSVAGSLTVAKPMAGTIAAPVTAAGSLTVRKPLAGGLSAAVTLTGTLTSASAGLSGSVSVTVSTSGALTVRKPLSGALSVTVSVSGNLSGPVIATGPGLIRAELTWTVRHGGDVTYRVRHEADHTHVVRHAADLTYKTRD